MSEYDHPPCCAACASAEGGACFDCYGTGHAHPPDLPKPDDEQEAS